MENKSRSAGEFLAKKTNLVTISALKSGRLHNDRTTLQYSLVSVFLNHHLTSQFVETSLLLQFL